MATAARGRLGRWQIPRWVRQAFPAERRFFLCRITIQALVSASLLLALSSTRTLDALTSEKTVRGSVVEAPVDRASGLVLFGGAALSTIAVLWLRQRRRRWGGFWMGYGLFLLFAGLEELDWLKESALNPRLLGHRVEAFHDLLAKLIQPLRAGTSEYPLPAGLVVLAAVVAAGGLVLLFRRWAPRNAGVDVGLLALIGLGVFLGSLGVLIDADLLPKPAAIDWKAHIEEPLEAVGLVLPLWDLRVQSEQARRMERPYSGVSV
jgi:hypothetical protein